LKVFISGGRGYIGGRLREYLADRSAYEVVIGSRSPSQRLDPRFSEVVTDWRSDDSLRACCSGVDSIVHLAAMNARDCAMDPIGALSTNGVSTARLLEAALKEGVKRFIYLSTAHVYGSPLEGVITESVCPAPVHPYATSHRAAEDVVVAASRSRKIEAVVLRLSNAFGAPKEKGANCWDLLFTDLCRQAVMSHSLVLQSSGMQRRDFVAITDVCRAIKHFLDLPSAMLGKEIFNVGGNWSPTVFDVACLVADACQRRMGYRPVITRKPPLVGETPANLDYRIDALIETGFQIKADRPAELDDLMSFCVNAFMC
jgi:UDP-glucose 4-epimerase